MSRPQDRLSRGSIPGLLLPPRAWNALAKAGIRGLEDLKAMSERLHLLPGVGSKTARIIRDAVERLNS